MISRGFWFSFIIEVFVSFFILGFEGVVKCDLVWDFFLGFSYIIFFTVFLVVRWGFSLTLRVKLRL